MPAFYVNGNAGFEFGYSLAINSCNCPLSETENHFQWVTNWTKIYGNHTIGWGADLRRAQQQRIPSDSHRSGEITFEPSTTGSYEADLAVRPPGRPPAPAWPHCCWASPIPSRDISRVLGCTPVCDRPGCSFMARTPGAQQLD